ncbi:MAG: choline dehydrogenase [Acetobacter sp.]|uniref:choline dehydrogenase n=1 Tax=Acetobacter sp. TaxID=440 RepID=UPI0039E9F630
MKFDYIIVGSGAAGSVMASRLSEDGQTRVLVIEAGGSDRHLIIDMPAALPFAYQSKKLGWGFQAGPEPHLGGRSIDEKRGRVLGGTTSINAMIYNRGNPLDFDGWAQNGLPNWSYADCLPYFRKMETFSGGSDIWRGGDGPMQISRCKAEHKLYDAFLRGGEQAGFHVTDDHNGYRQEGLHIAQAYIHEGYRWSTSRGYLRPAQVRENLTLLARCLVNRILIDKGSAVGVEVDDHGTPRQIFCEREVILCAGAFNSPQLLMLSGVGDADELATHNIALKADVPGIGRNLENHPGVNVQYATAYEDSLVSELSSVGRVKLGLEWLIRKKGLGASNFFEAGAFLKTRDTVAFPNMQFEFLPMTRYVSNGKLVAVPGFQFWMDLSRPQSRGRVSLRSANPKDAPFIVFNHLSERQDLQDLIDGVRLAQDMIRQPVWDRYRGKALAPVADAATDADLEEFVRANLGTSYHPSGTCRMGTDNDAVVDDEGRVKAIENLRVVDASIMPHIVTANLSATTIMIAEKIADRVRNIVPLPRSDARYYRDPV